VGVYATITDRYFHSLFEVPELAPIVVWNIRMAMVIMGVLAGAEMQGVLRNPLASFITAVVMCFTGMIGFTGLVAPHITCMCVGGDNRFVLPDSALFGAAFLVAAYIIAREVVAPAIIPVWIITSFVGCLLFLCLIIRKKKEYW